MYPPSLRRMRPFSVGDKITWTGRASKKTENIYKPNMTKGREYVIENIDEYGALYCRDNAGEFHRVPRGDVKTGA